MLKSNWLAARFSLDVLVAHTGGGFSQELNSDGN